MALKSRGGYTDSAPSKRKGISGRDKGRKVGRKASAWDQLQAGSLAEQSDTLDVHNSQQLTRGKPGQVQGPGKVEAGATVVGVLVFILVWLVWGLGGFLLGTVSSATTDDTLTELKAAHSLGVPDYWVRQEKPIGNSNMTKDCFFPVDRSGTVTDDSTCHRKLSELQRPQWHVVESKAAFAKAGVDPLAEDSDSLGGWLGFGHMSLLRAAVALLAGLVIWGVVRTWGMRKLSAANLMYDNTEINTHEHDQHIAPPEEVLDMFSVFPDVGATSPVQPSSLIGHVMMSNDGAPKVKLVRRYGKDVRDADGEVLHYEGEPVRGEDDEVLYDMVPMFDEDFAHELFSKSGVPANRGLRKFFSPRKTPYNPGAKNFDKTGAQDTVAAHIEELWAFPEYEPQRPAGVYIVDEGAVNTMILAMTRAGKGQTYIEPMIDMWSREQRQNNMVINDPKGELLVKNYARLSVRGYQVVQFNLINPLKTDIYNPLAMAVHAAREGNSTSVAMYVENIAEVFFPVEGADDPVWPNAAANAFKRAAYGMIDYYMEEERQMRKRASAEGWDAKVLETRLDESWGKVTLYNCYQLFVQLSAKKLKDPVARLKADMEAGKYGDPEEAENNPALVQLADEAIEQQISWNGEAEVDMLSLFFNATDLLPKNSMRTQVGNANNALKSMAGAEKMLASVYGIAITAMSFFVDPTISTMTSGTLSQNVDLGGLSFPRRFGVRFDQDYVTRYNLVGCQAKWDCYSDAGFTESLGKDFEHEDIVSREGWAKAYFEGKFADDVSYLRLRLLNTESGTLIKTMFFRFTKGYQTNLSGRAYVKDPIRGVKIVKNGVLVEMVRDPAKEGRIALGSTKFRRSGLNIDQLSTEEINSGDDSLIKQVETQRDAVQSMTVNYAEEAKAVFLVTPPHLMKYAKLILILLKQLVDLNFDKSYMTKPNQKPQYKTRYMLDELGNLQSEGSGIAGLETMLSIGLGQEQQFTLILQTLQQLKDVYGDSVDKIVQGNVANIVFLKSTDDSMIETLSKMSGTKHETRTDSISIAKDMDKVALQTDGKVTYQRQTSEVPVISYNNLAFLPPRNSIVFSASNPPIWNRNETILPMSFALFKNTIKVPGKKFTLQTIPTLSAAKDFDVRLNQPNFFEMVEKRIVQAAVAGAADQIYRAAYDLDDFGMSRLDPDVSAREIMDINDVIVGRRLYDKMLAKKSAAEADALNDELAEIYGDDLPMSQDVDPGMSLDDFDPEEMLAAEARQLMDDAETDEAVVAETRLYENRSKDWEIQRYAEGTVSRAMLVDSTGGVVLKGLDAILASAFAKCGRDFVDDDVFALVDEDTLIDRHSQKVMIGLRSSSEVSSEMKALAEAGTDPQSSVHMEEEPDPDSMVALNRYWISPRFKRALAELDTWKGLADGRWDTTVAELMRFADEN